MELQPGLREERRLLLPGDSYVDAIGSDGYNWYPDGPATMGFASRPSSKHTQNFAVAHGKPWMAVEYGVQEDPAVPGRKGQWFTDALDDDQVWP